MQLWTRVYILCTFNTNNYDYPFYSIYYVSGMILIYINSFKGVATTLWVGNYYYPYFINDSSLLKSYEELQNPHKS